ncbi:MAG TPA: hypothetical protein VFS62_00745 [Chloroflexota bacterium]|nr:hypothetical protein [Chloroflexota bacterium]
MNAEDSGAEVGRRPVRSVTEIAVELTIAWLKRVESTADGRDPKEVVQAMDEFFAAVLEYHKREADVRSREPASANV